MAEAAQDNGIHSVCIICKEEYTTDLSAIGADQSHLPVQSHTCSHILCFSCLQSHHAAQSASRMRKWLDCPQCRAKLAYQVEKPIFSRSVCGLLSLVRQLQGNNQNNNSNNNNAASSSTLSSSENKASDNNEEESQPLSRSSTLLTTAKEEDEDDDQNEHNNPIIMAEDVASSSPWTMENVNESSEEHDDTANAPIVDSSTRTIQVELAASVVMETSSTIVQETISNEALDQPPPTSAFSWEASVLRGNPTRRLYRIRVFKNDAKVTGSDPLGKLPALWCLQEGLIAACARILPRHVRTSEEARAYLSRPVKAIMLDCRNSDELRPSWAKELKMTNTSSLTLYGNGYRRFAAMNSGDVVAMMVKQDHNVTMVYFGVISSQEVVVKTKRELKAMHFPSPQIFESSVPFQSGRLMLRRVRWMKQCRYQTLPQRQRELARRCLLVDSPFWLSDVTVNGGLSALAAGAFGRLDPI